METLLPKIYVTTMRTKPEVCNGLSALAFAAVHLPVWVGAAPVGFGLVVSVVVLNAVGGLTFGYLFVTRGIVAAMLAHARADCVIQLIGPLIT